MCAEYGKLNSKIAKIIITIIFISSMNEDHTYNIEKQQTMKTYTQNSANIHVPRSGIFVKRIKYTQDTSSIKDTKYDQ